MKIRQGDIVETEPFEFYDGNTYNHVCITFPTTSYMDTKETWLIDALPCDENGCNTPEGYEVGVPTSTTEFTKRVGNINETR